MKKKLGKIIFFAVYAVNYCNNYQYSSPLDEKEVLQIVERILPVLGQSIKNTIIKDTDQFFIDMNHYIDIEKPIWLCSFMQYQLMANFLQNNPLSRGNPINIIRTLEYNDHINLYVCFFSKNLGLKNEIVYITDLQRSILKEVSNNVYDDMINIFSNDPTIVLMGNNREISIVPITPNNRNPQIMSIHKEYLGYSTVAYKINDEEFNMISKSTEDLYQRFYNSELLEIIYIANLMNIAKIFIKNSWKFKKLKENIYEKIKSDPVNQIEHCKLLSKNKLRFLLYIFNDNNQYLNKDTLMQIINLQKPNLIVSIYKFLY